MSFLKNIIAESDASPGISPEDRMAQAKHRHDLASAVLSLKALSDILDEGYQFNDDLASHHKASLKKAIAIIDRFTLTSR